MDKKTLTFALPSEEMQILKSLASQKNVSKAAILRLSLRLYQILDDRREKGQKFSLKMNFPRKKWSYCCYEWPCTPVYLLAAQRDRHGLGTEPGTGVVAVVAPPPRTMLKNPLPEFHF